VTFPLTYFDFGTVLALFKSRTIYMYRYERRERKRYVSHSLSVPLAAHINLLAVINAWRLRQIIAFLLLAVYQGKEGVCHRRQTTRYG
jgi:hypothetical protein